MFPSPLGVIFSLMLLAKVEENEKLQFPSPLGVIFSLISVDYSLVKYFRVSVSSRSYILSYGYNNFQLRSLKELHLVSVSSRSYILSYFSKNIIDLLDKIDSFRLLTELYSLL